VPVSSTRRYEQFDDVVDDAFSVVYELTLTFISRTAAAVTAPVRTLRRVIPRLHDEAGSTSWLVEPASSCKQGITY